MVWSWQQIVDMRYVGHVCSVCVGQAASRAAMGLADFFVKICTLDGVLYS